MGVIQPVLKRGVLGEQAALKIIKDSFHQMLVGIQKEGIVSLSMEIVYLKQ